MHCSPSQTRARATAAAHLEKLVFPFPSGCKTCCRPRSQGARCCEGGEPDLAGPRTVSQETRLAGPLYVVAPELGIYKQRARVPLGSPRGRRRPRRPPRRRHQLARVAARAPPAPAPEEADVATGRTTQVSVASKERDRRQRRRRRRRRRQPTAPRAAPSSAAPPGPRRRARRRSTPTTRSASHSSTWSPSPPPPPPRCRRAPHA